MIKLPSEEDGEEIRKVIEVDTKEEGLNNEIEEILNLCSMGMRPLLEEAIEEVEELKGVLIEEEVQEEVILTLLA